MGSMSKSRFLLFRISSSLFAFFLSSGIRQHWYWGSIEEEPQGVPRTRYRFHPIIHLVKLSYEIRYACEMKLWFHASIDATNSIPLNVKEWTLKVQQSPRRLVYIFDYWKCVLLAFLTRCCGFDFSFLKAKWLGRHHMKMSYILATSPPIFLISLIRKRKPISNNMTVFEFQSPLSSLCFPMFMHLPKSKWRSSYYPWVH